MRKEIEFELHAVERLIQRAQRFGLDYFSARRKVIATIRNGKLSKRKHKSRRNITYYCYFNEGLSFYIICQEKPEIINVKSIIIEKGKE